MWSRSYLPELTIAVLVTAIPSGWGLYLAQQMVQAGLEVLEPSEARADTVDLSRVVPVEEEEKNPCAENAASRECLLGQLGASEEVKYFPDNLCTDGRGNQGVFDVVLFSSSYSWTLGQDENVELAHLPVDLPGLLDTPAFTEYLRQAPEVFVVGVASCEGYATDRRGQIELARNRGVLLKGLIETRRGMVRSQRKPTDALCLGVFRGECEPGDTSAQRPVLLLALFERAPGLAVEDCIQRVFAEDRQLAFLATGYDPGFSPANPGLDCR